MVRLVFSVAMVLTGLYLMVFGNTWGPVVFDWLPDSETGAWLELVVPFLPMLFIGAGAVIYVKGVPH